jgi:gamma-glutamyltranspeptidase/glutathione hydrolase
MNIKRLAKASALAIAVIGAAGAVVYHFVTKDPTPIRVDPGIYDDYAGYYVLPNGFLITIRRDGRRLVSIMPERAPTEIFPETETRFFLKGSRARWTFHRDESGRVDYAIADRERADKKSVLPSHPQGTNGLIAATTGGKAVEVGLQILKEGGGAVDAAMATAICEVVHAGGSYVSFAGPMMMVYYDAATGKVYYLDAEFATPLEEKDPRSIPKRGGRTALVPGFMSGVQVAHRRFGKVPFKRLFSGAIEMAEKGEVVSPVMEWWIGKRKAVLSRYPETKKIFTRPDGTFLVRGDLFQQPNLAATLKKVAAQGATYIYEGDWAKKFVEVVQREGGKITLQDMKQYEAVWEEPLHTTFRDYHVYGTGPSALGGANIIQALNLLELANLRQYGPYITSAQSLFCLMQISACQSTTRHLSPETRMSKAWAEQTWKTMQDKIRPGPTPKLHVSAHTDGLVVVDRWGNMAVLNHTINTMLWGDTGLFVDGISIPDSAKFQGHDIAKLGPGKHLPNAMSPLIVCQNGKPVLGCAATGGGLHAKTLQVLANILDFGMDPQTAVDTPAFVGWTVGSVEQDTFETKLLDELKAMGLKIDIISHDKAGMSRGYWAGVLIDPITGRMRGGVNRGMGAAVVAY